MQSLMRKTSKFAALQPGAVRTVRVTCVQSCVHIRRSYSLAKSLASYCQLHAMTRSTRHADSEDIGLSDKRDLYGR